MVITKPHPDPPRRGGRITEKRLASWREAPLPYELGRCRKPFFGSLGKAKRTVIDFKKPKQWLFLNYLIEQQNILYFAKYIDLKSNIC